MTMSSMLALSTGDSTQPASTLVPGRYNLDIAVGSAGGLPAGTVLGIINLPRVQGKPAKGLKATANGTGADNKGFGFKIWIIEYELDSAGYPTRFCSIKLYGSGTAQLSTAMGVAGSTAIPSTSRIADTLTFQTATSASTPQGVGGSIEAAVNSPGPQVYSPTGNVEGELFIPDLGQGGAGWPTTVGIEFALNEGPGGAGGAATSANLFLDPL